MLTKIKLLIACFALACGAHAQSFFKPLPKLQQPIATAQRNIITKTVVTATDSTYGALRPIFVGAAYSLPDRHLMAGVGFGFQNITYNYTTGRSYCNYSISAIGFGGGAIAPTSPDQVVSYGIMLGALNNTVMAGAAINSGKVNFVVSIGINFNN